MTLELQRFLDSLTEDDFMGSKTKKSIRNKAISFLGSSHYSVYESYKGFDIHNSLLCLIYDQI